MSVDSCQPTALNFYAILDNFPNVIDPNQVDAPGKEFIAFAKEAFQSLVQQNKNIEDIIKATEKERDQSSSQDLLGLVCNYKAQEVEIKYRLSKILDKKNVEPEFFLLAARDWEVRLGRSIF